MVSVQFTVLDLAIVIVQKLLFEFLRLISLLLETTTTTSKHTWLSFLALLLKYSCSDSY